MASNFKTPPFFNKGDDYEKWEKKINIWKTLTTLEEKKQGAAVFLVLDSLLY